MSYEFVITAGDGRLINQGKFKKNESFKNAASNLIFLFDYHNYSKKGYVLTIGPSLTTEEILSFVGATQGNVMAKFTITASEPIRVQIDDARMKLVKKIPHREGGNIHAYTFEIEHADGVSTVYNDIDWLNG